MAEGLLIQVGADVNNAIRGLDKLTSKLGDVDDAIPSLIKNSANLEDALDKLGKQGLLSVNSLGQSISDFKTLFNNATDPAQAKKYGDALKVLQSRQQSLIDTGLGVVEAEKKIGEAHSANVQGTQRLSASFLGLSKVFGVLPPELAHLTHSFDQIFQQFEKTAHGTDTTGDAIKKFAGVLGEVGLGLVIGVAVGLLADFVKGLLDSDAALEKATEQSIEFNNAIRDIESGLKNFEERSKFLTELSNLVIDINFGKGFQNDLLKLQTGMVNLIETQGTLEDAAKQAADVFNKAFKGMQEGISDAGRAALGAVVDLKSISDEQLKSFDLSESDNKLVENVRKTGEEVVKIQEQIAANINAQDIQAAKNRALRADKAREDAKKENDELRGLLESRANIIKEFTAKFASIGDPFPSFFSKNLPLGKVEDKALRSALENAFKVFEGASKDFLNSKKLDPATMPLEIKFKPLIIGVTDLVREIEEKFGAIKGVIEEGVNKGIIEVPIDFRLPAEGNGQALKAAENLVDDFVKAIEGLTGQKRAILNIDTEFLASLDPAKERDVLEDITRQLNVMADGMHPVVKITATGDVKIDIDKEKIGEDLAKQMNEAIVSAASDTLAGFGEALGDALSTDGLQDAFKKILGVIGNGLSAIGKALIKAGVLATGLGKAIKAFALNNPALAIGLGVAMVALAKALQNSIANTARERGGPVQKGFAYTVNERGQEAFLSNSGKLSMIEGGIQTFKPWESGKILPASIAKAFAQRFNMPRFESGGLITGPTFGLLGEGAGISRFNPEVIAPLNTLKGLLGFGGENNINLNLAMQTRGKDLKLIGNRTDRSQRRTT